MSSNSNEEDFLIFKIDDDKVKVPIQIGDPPTTKTGIPRWIIPDYWKGSNELLIDEGEGKGYQKVMGKTKPLGTWRNRIFPLEVQDDPVVNELEGDAIITGGWEIASKNNPKQRFIDVVLAFNDIYNRTGKMEGMEAYDNFGNKKLGSRIIQNKFISFAKSIGLFDEQGKKRKARKKETKLEKKLLAFSEQPAIERWQQYTTYAVDKKRQTMVELKKALHILDLSPAEFLKGDETDPDMQDMNLRQHAFEKWLDNRRDTPTFHGDDGKIWSLNDWARAEKRPYFAGEGNKFTKAGDRIASKKRAGSKVSSGSQVRNFVEALKHFSVTAGMMVGGKKVGSQWEIATPELKYNTLKMTAKEILAVQHCLDNPILEFSEKSLALEYEGEIVEDVYVPHKLEGEKIDVPYKTTYADWEDAKLYFMIALDVGWRASEGLTATANYLSATEDPAFSTGIYIEGKDPNLPEGIMFLKFLTRKTWKMKDKKGKLRTFHSEMILTSETRELVQAKVNKVEAGMKQIGKIPDDELFKEYGIERWTINAEGEKIKNNHHALIGHDGKYIDSATMKFPTQHKLSPRQVFELKKAGKPLPQLKATENQKKLHAIMRKCFVKSGVNLDEVIDGIVIGQYWLQDTLHSLRHVFAQKWLLQSGWNFTHVARKGHWASTKILEDAYGGQGNKTYMIDSIHFAQKKLEDVEKEEQQKMAESLLKFAQSTKEGQTDGASGSKIT